MAQRQLRDGGPNIKNARRACWIRSVSHLVHLIVLAVANQMPARDLQEGFRAQEYSQQQMPRSIMLLIVEVEHRTLIDFSKTLTLSDSLKNSAEHLQITPATFGGANPTFHSSP